MATILDPRPPVDPMQKAMTMVSNSTVSTAAINVVAGYVMGCGLSLFGAMISAETATQKMGTADFFRYSMRNAHGLGCSFCFFGFLFGGMDVALEKRRGRKDKWNPTVTGGLLGGAYGWRSYKYPGLVGGVVGGAVISLAFEKMLDSLGMSER